MVFVGAEENTDQKYFKKMLELTKTQNEITSIHAFIDESDLIKFKKESLGIILFSGTVKELKEKDVNFWKTFLGDRPMYRFPFNFEGLVSSWHYDIDICIKAIFAQLKGDFFIIIKQKK